MPAVPTYPPMPPVTEVTRRTSRRRVAALLAVCILAPVLAVVAAVAGLKAVGTPDEAVEAAIRGHAQRGGSSQAHVVVAARAGGCAVVVLYDPVADATTSVAVLQVGDRWKFGRQSGDDVHFDTDDVRFDPDGCRRVATSTGPLVNGAPPQEFQGG
jgi:hypothetical protein